MGQSIPVGPWPDFETAQAFGGNALRAAADASGNVVSEWAATQRADGLWQAEGYLHPVRNVACEGSYVIAGDGEGAHIPLVNH